MKNLLIASLFIISTQLSFSQVCNVSVTPLDTTICPGDSVLISAIASVTATGQSFDFNTGTLPPGWSTTGSPVFSTPCGAGPNGSDYFWASTAASGTTPTMTTAAFDVGCGGNIVFDMVYSIQSNPAPCEGPDQADEGVELQYSIDGGANWITMVYYSPGGYELPSNPGTTNGVASGITPYTSWNTFTTPLPLGAQSTSTMFRWIQLNSSSSAYDNWGLENISIQAGPCSSAVVNWSNGLMDTTSFYGVPTADTIFIAYVYDTLGVLQCISDSIFININTASLTYDLEDTLFAYCPTDTLPATVTNLANANSPYSFDWSTGGIDTLEMLPTNGIKKDTIWYYVDITDGCGFIYPDSVVMIVNQTLEIDSLISSPSSACFPDGLVQAFVNPIGITDDIDQPFFHWTGPGNPGSNNLDGTVMTDIPGGYYYFTVTDDVCTELDSVLVDIQDPPIAQLSGTPVSGCGPLEVTFSNTSENTSSYEWNFGNGNVITVNDLSSQTETFQVSSNVMLVAFASPTCSDTAYLTIDVVPCGCTDPIAINYNPSATLDDGSCIYPIPIVIAPNIFTPNGDHANDVFELTLTNVVELELTILNRWGNLMYQNSGPNPVWDGLTEGGTEAEEGTYFYKYVAKGVDGTEIEGHGFLNLFRD